MDNKLVGIGPEQFTRIIAVDCPEIYGTLATVATHVPFLKRQVAPYQGAILYALAKRFNFVDANILEIGTAWGYSAAMMAHGAPKAKITTLNPKGHEFKRAKEYLAYTAYKNISFVQKMSTEYLFYYEGPKLDLIFVDGDHKNVHLDMPWWDWLNVGGIMFHHDYSPSHSARPTQICFDRINDFADWIGRKPDLLFIDDTDVGMAGWKKRASDTANYSDDLVL